MPPRLIARPSLRRDRAEISRDCPRPPPRLIAGRAFPTGTPARSARRCRQPAPRQRQCERTQENGGVDLRRLRVASSARRKAQICVPASRPLTREYVTGSPPPRLTPVSARAANSCQKEPASDEPRQPRPPRRRRRASRSIRRAAPSAAAPMSSAAGAPTRKSAAASRPPSFSSFSCGVSANSCAHAERLGASRF